jgi:uncharacterized protein involved in exopolysaccharide biosynthesis
MNPAGSPPRDLFSAASAFMPRALRAKWFGIVALAAGLLGTTAWVLSTRRMYRSEAVVMYEPATTALAGNAADSPRQVAARLQDMVTSRQRLEAIITSMNLYPATVDRRGMVEAVDEMRTRLKITGHEGYTFRVSFDMDSRERSQQVLGTLLKSVIDDDLHRRQKDAEDAKSFLDRERRRADQELRAKEGALTVFLAKHPQLAAETSSTGGTIRAAAAEHGVASTSGEVASLEMQAAQIEEALSGALHRPGPGPAGPPSLDPSIAAAQARAESELHAAQADLADKQSRYTNEHPDVKAAAFHLQQAEAAVRQAHTAAVASLAGAAAARSQLPKAAVAEDAGSSARVSSLRRALGAVRAQIASLRSRPAPKIDTNHDVRNIVSVDTDFTQLSREVAEARDRQQQIEGKQFQAQLMATLVGGNQAGGLVITDPPFRPLSPVSGGRTKVAMAGAAISGFLGLLAVVAAGLLDRRVYDAHDVVKAVHADIVVIVPRLTGKGG